MRRKKLLKKVDTSKITTPLSFIKNRNNKSYHSEFADQEHSSNHVWTAGERVNIIIS